MVALGMHTHTHMGAHRSWCVGIFVHRRPHYGPSPPGSQPVLSCREPQATWEWKAELHSSPQRPLYEALWARGLLWAECWQSDWYPAYHYGRFSPAHTRFLVRVSWCWFSVFWRTLGQFCPHWSWGLEERPHPPSSWILLEACHLQTMLACYLWKSWGHVVHLCIVQLRKPSLYFISSNPICVDAIISHKPGALCASLPFLDCDCPLLIGLEVPHG